MPAELKYAAFISYRHEPLSRGWAIWLHRQIERYRVPGSLQSSNGCPKRLGKVFRDEDELAASSDLSAAIDEALGSSRFLIVICSPSTPHSKWVNEEVRRFRSLGRERQILSLLVKGTPEESFPPALLEARRANPDASDDVTLEPCAADVRDVHHDGARHTREVAKLRLLATMLGVDFDDLYRREARAQRARWAKYAIAASALLVVMAVLTAYAFAQRQLATNSRDDAVRALQESERQLRDARLQRAAALASIDALIFQVQREMEQRPTLAQSRINLMNLALRKLDAIEEVSAVWDGELKRARAVATMQIADALAQLRRYPAATVSSESAAAQFREIYAASPADLRARRDLVLCLVRHARIASKNATDDVARDALRQAELLLTDTGTDAERFSLAIARGDIAATHGDLPAAIESFHDASRIAPPGSQQRLLACSRVASVLLMQTKPDTNALRSCTEALDACVESVSATPISGWSYAYSIANAHLRSAELHLRLGDTTIAVERSRSAADRLSQLHQEMPEREDVAFTLGAAHVCLAASTAAQRAPDHSTVRERAVEYLSSLHDRERARALTNELASRCADPSSPTTRPAVDSESD